MSYVTWGRGQTTSFRAMFYAWWMTRFYRGHALRAGRHSLPGHAYMVTTATVHRERFFLHFDAARRVIRSLSRMDQLGATETLCFVLMPDHLHWLFILGERLSLSSTVRQFKSYSARSLGGPSWQAGFHDHCIRAEESLVQAARYIVANPRRAGLVKKIGDYPHWDANWL